MTSIEPDVRFEMFKFLNDFTTELIEVTENKALAYNVEDLVLLFGPFVAAELNQIQFKPVVSDTIHHYAKIAAEKFSAKIEK